MKINFYKKEKELLTALAGFFIKTAQKVTVYC